MSASDELPVKVYSPESSASHPARLFGDVLAGRELAWWLADKLVRVIDTDGREDWLLIHIEVQGEDQHDFAERLFVYNYRLYDRYRRPVVSLAVLADE